MRGALTAAVVAACAVGACSGFGSDTGTSSDDAGAGPDAAVTDASPGDAGPVAFGAGFCKRHTELFLCDDFDEGPIGFNWSETTTSGGGTLALAPSTRSAPNALVSSSSADGQGWAYLVKEVGNTTTHVIIGFDMRLDALGASYTEGPQLSVLDQGSGDYYAVALRIQPNGALSVKEVSQAGVIADHPFIKTPVPGEWARFEMDFDLAAARLRVTLDESSTPTIDDKLAPSILTGLRRVNVGLDYFLVPSWSAAFDNVTIDVK